MAAEQSVGVEAEVKEKDLELINDVVVRLLDNQVAILHGLAQLNMEPMKTNLRAKAAETVALLDKMAEDDDDQVQPSTR